MLKEKTDRLEWFLNFMNLDLDEMQPRDEYNIVTELLAVSHGHKPEDGYPPRFNIDEHAKPLLLLIKRQDMKRLHKSLKKFFEAMIEKISTVLAYEQKWKPVEDFLHSDLLAKVETRQTIEVGINIWKAANGKVETKIQELTIPSPRGGLIKEDAPKDKRIAEEIEAVETWALNIRQKYGNERYFYRFDEQALRSTPIMVSAFSPSNREQGFILEFLRALDGVPLGALRRCPECGSWFLHISKHKREFCSNKCAAKKNSRERRKRLKEDRSKTYEQELKEGAHRARKSYEKRIKEIHPRAKINRRPRKQNGKDQ